MSPEMCEDMIMVADCAQPPNDPVDNIIGFAALITIGIFLGLVVYKVLFLCGI